MITDFRSHDHGGTLHSQAVLPVRRVPEDRKNAGGPQIRPRYHRIKRKALKEIRRALKEPLPSF